MLKNKLNNHEEYINQKNSAISMKIQRLNPLFLLIMCLSMTALILVLAHPESFQPDENLYLLLQKSIHWGFPDARLIIPALIALFFFIGFDIYTIQFLIPLLFMNLTIIVTYFLAKTMYGEKEAIIATLFLFTFPFFWESGLSILLDIPLAALSSSFILFFYLGVEKGKKYLPIAAIFLLLAFLTKASAILLIPPAFLYVLIANKRLILTKEFIISVVIAPLLFLFVYILFHIFLSVDLVTTTARNLYMPIDYWEMLSLGYAPALLFAFFGISREKRTIFLGLIVLIFITFFSLINFHVRYLSPLFPIFGIFGARGYINLRDKFNIKKIVDLVLIIFLIISVVNSLYLVDLSNNTRWGVVTLSKHVNSIEGNVTIASDYNSGYLEVVTAKNVIRIPRYYEFNDEIVEIEYFWNIVTNKSASNSSIYAELYKSGKIKPFFYYFDDEWIEDNHVDYVILSIYEESRSSEMMYHHPKYAWIEIPFIKTQIYTSDSFQSKLYELCEEKYEKIDEVYRENRLIFIIYKIYT